MLTVAQKFYCSIQNVLSQPHTSFDELCEQLATICIKDQQVTIARGEQRTLYAQLIALQSNAADNIALIVSSPLLVLQWMIVIAHCDSSEYRDLFLDQEVKMIEQLKDLDLPVISGIFSCFPSHVDSKNLSPILKSLLPHLVEHRKNQRTLPPDEMILALRGLKSIDYSDEIVSEILTELAWHVEKNTKMANWSNNYALSLAFSGLQHIPNTSELKELLTTLLPHLREKTKNAEWFDSRELALIMLSLKERPIDQTTSSILTELIPHISHNQQITPEDIGIMLSGLQSMENHSNVNQILAAIKTHLLSTEKQKQYLSLSNINDALSGLQHLAGSTEALQILTILTTHLRTPIHRPTKEFLQTWFDNTANQLKEYLNQDLTKAAASAFLEKASTLLNSDTPDDSLTPPSKQKRNLKRPYDQMTPPSEEEPSSSQKRQKVRETPLSPLPLES